jgi:hypothetical protein
MVFSSVRSSHAKRGTPTKHVNKARKSAGTLGLLTFGASSLFRHLYDLENGPFSCIKISPEIPYPQKLPLLLKENIP